MMEYENDEEFNKMKSAYLAAMEEMESRKRFKELHERLEEMEQEMEDVEVSGSAKPLVFSLCLGLFLFLAWGFDDILNIFCELFPF